MALSASEQPQNFYPRPPRGGRPLALSASEQPQNFYPRPPRGGRQARQSKFSTAELFLSTPSARRATLTSDHARRIQPHYFYPRPPRGGRRHPAQLVWLARSISIHALREEGDPPPTVEAMPPMVISIHALREEGDPAPLYGITPPAYFYPRPPRGGRQ